MFSKACEYGLKAVIIIAQDTKNNKRSSLKEIAKKINSPEAFTAKILQSLARQNIVKSIKGAHGGFEFDKQSISTITLDKIVIAIDGDQIYKRCGLGLKACNEEKPCPVHQKFKSIKTDLKLMLEHTTLEELAIDLDNGDSFMI